MSGQLRVNEQTSTITSKAVLILSRSTPGEAYARRLPGRPSRPQFLPILFDFKRPTNRDSTEIVSPLAHLARFVIADLTDPRSIPQGLTAIIQRLLSVPVRPLLLGPRSEWAMFSDLAQHPQVIALFHYTDDQMLLRSRHHRAGGTEKHVRSLAHRGSDLSKVTLTISPLAINPALWKTFTVEAKPPIRHSLPPCSTKGKF
jgi:hypothetical protein